MERTKCLIIGSGPAGYTAAIYASRANLSPIEYSGMQPGGQLTQTTEVENFPGYPQGVDGNQMMLDLLEQAQRFGTDVRQGEIVKVDFSKADPDYKQKPDIKWNFTKYLINKKGQVIARFEPTAAIAEIEKQIEELLK